MLAQSNSATFNSHDPRYTTFTREVEPKKGGAPPNPAYRHLFQCGSSMSLITHAKTCMYLPRALRELAEDQGAKTSLGRMVVGEDSSRGVKRSHQTMSVGGESLETSSGSQAELLSPFPIADWTQLGKEELEKTADLSLLIWICDSGIAFRAIDHRMFKRCVVNET